LHCYHHTDLDGHSSGFLVHRICEVNNIPHTTRDFTATNYNNPMTRHKKNEDIIFIVDLSFTIDTAYKLINICNSADVVIWVDHHLSSQTLFDNKEFEWPNNLFLFYTMERCGVANVFQLLKGPFSNFMDDIKKNKQGNGRIFNLDPVIELPFWISLIDDYDRWVKKLPDTDNFVSGIMSYNMSLVIRKRNKNDEFNGIYAYLNREDKPYRYIEEGKSILRYLNSRYKRELNYTFEIDVFMDGKKYKVLCKNATHNSSNFMDKFDNYDAASVFYFDGKSGIWNHSIYANKDSEFDCARFSERFGGGGHKKAAGFQMDKFNGPLWINDLNEVHIV